MRFATDSPLPRMRHVDVIPVELQGRRAFCIRDPLAFAPEPLVLGTAGLFIASHLDGRHTADQVRAAVLRQFPGSDVGLPEIRHLLGSLSKGCYLDDRVAATRIARVRAEFERAEVRPAWHAGAAYPHDPRELAAMLDRFFAAPTRTEDGAVPVNSAHQLAAVMCPHIDLRAGGEVYPPAFTALAEAAVGEPPIELYVILGVAHNGGTEPGKSFAIATDKHYVTPLGQAHTERGVIKDWSHRAGRDVTEQQWLHRTEHSVEFPMLFLQYVQAHAELPRYAVVPVLLGGVDRYLHAGEDPLQAPEITAELTALRAAVRASGKRALYLLSVDLAHIGPKFGHRERVDDAAAAACEQADRKLLGLRRAVRCGRIHPRPARRSQPPQRGRRFRPVLALPAAGRRRVPRLPAQLRPEPAARHRLAGQLRQHGLLPHGRRSGPSPSPRRHGMTGGIDESPKPDRNPLRA